MQQGYKVLLFKSNGKKHTLNTCLIQYFFYGLHQPGKKNKFNHNLPCNIRHLSLGFLSRDLGRFLAIKISEIISPSREIREIYI